MNRFSDDLNSCYFLSSEPWSKGSYEEPGEVCQECGEWVRKLDYLSTMKRMETPGAYLGGFSALLVLACLCALTFGYCCFAGNTEDAVRTRCLHNTLSQEGRDSSVSNKNCISHMCCHMCLHLYPSDNKGINKRR